MGPQRRLALRGVLTGVEASLPDLPLPVRNGTVRLLGADNSSAVFTLPFENAMLAALRARPNGRVNFYVGEYVDGVEQSSLVLDLPRSGLSVSRGAQAWSVTLRGEGLVVHAGGATVEVGEILSESRTSAGERIWSLPLVNEVVPGDTLEYGAVQLIAQDVTYVFGATGNPAYMEVSSG